MLFSDMEPVRGRVAGLVVLVMLLSCTVCRTNQEAQGYTNIIFLTQPTSQYTVVNRTFSLPCRAQGVNSQGETEFLSVIFYKNNEMIPIYPIEDYEYLFDSTSRTTTGLVSPQTSITDDRATFQCKLLIDDRITTPPITITVADGRPGAITLTEYSKTIANYTVIWDREVPMLFPKTGPLLGYSVSLFAQNGSLIYTINITNSNISSYTFDGLEPDTEYQVLVVAYNVFGLGNETDLFPIRTESIGISDDLSQGTMPMVVAIVVSIMLIAAIAVAMVLIGLCAYRNRVDLMKWLNWSKNRDGSSLELSSFHFKNNHPENLP